MEALSSADTLRTCTTGSYSSSTEESDGMQAQATDVDAPQPVERVPSGIEKKFNVYNGCIGCFLRAFTPTKTNIPLWIPNEGPTRLRCADAGVTFPTIVASLPGSDRGFFALPQWADISVVFEVMQHEDDDPIGKISWQHDKTLALMTLHAKNIFVAQRRLFVFVVGIFGATARIFRFDHTAAVVSEGFNYCEHPGIFRTVGVCGADPSIQIPEKGDVLWSQKLLRKLKKPLLTPDERRMCRWVTVRDRNGDTLRFLAFRLLYTNPDIFSRATTVREAFRDGEVDAETGFYAILRDNVDNASHASSSSRMPDCNDSSHGLRGIAEVYTSADFGREELRCYDTLIEAFRDAILGHQRAYEAGIIHRDISEGNVLLVEDESFTGFIGDFDHSFNWKTFLKRRGLEVSRESWEQYARQRYVTNNGPGTRRDEPGDHSSSERRPIKRWAQERTGTLYFIAVEVLEGISLHEARHDLESFYWLLFWLMLRHTKHHPNEQKASDFYFKAPSESALAEYKSVWLIQNTPISVPGNRPMSKLLADLGDLCRRNCLLSHLNHPIEPLTHEAMLAKFNEALASPDWPEDDSAIPLNRQPSEVAKPCVKDDRQFHNSSVLDCDHYPLERLVRTVQVRSSKGAATSRVAWKTVGIGANLPYIGPQGPGFRDERSSLGAGLASAAATMMMMSSRRSVRLRSTQTSLSLTIVLIENAILRGIFFQHCSHGCITVVLLFLSMFVNRRLESSRGRKDEPLALAYPSGDACSWPVSVHEKREAQHKAIEQHLLTYMKESAGSRLRAANTVRKLYVD
ncbi:predicted protein [Postia placenta Mad-698-R]|nr:predicted protein [Postia placenta Mad-698-R]